MFSNATAIQNSKNDGNRGKTYTLPTDTSSGSKIALHKKANRSNVKKLYNQGIYLFILM